MTDEGDPRPTEGARRAPPVLGWRGRLEAHQRAIMRHPLALAGANVARAYERSGGGMLSGGLSFYAFFSLTPALLLFISLLGFLIDDAEERAMLLNDLVGQIDPIAELADVLIENLASSAPTTTIVGLIGLLWGFTGFYGSLQSSMQRMFPGPGTRDFLRTRIRGVLTVVLILGSMLAAVVFLIVVPVVTEWLADRCRDVTSFDSVLASQVCSIDTGALTALIGPLAAIGIAIVASVVVYVAVPPDGPTLAQAAWPAIVAGVVIGSLTTLFGLIAPLFARQWLTLGVVGSVFVSLVWFNLVFQVLLYGAAFARLRRDRDRVRNGPPRL